MITKTNWGVWLTNCYQFKAQMDEQMSDTLIVQRETKEKKVRKGATAVPNHSFLESVQRLPCKATLSLSISFTHVLTHTLSLSLSLSLKRYSIDFRCNIVQFHRILLYPLWHMLWMQCNACSKFLRIRKSSLFILIPLFFSLYSIFNSILNSMQFTTQNVMQQELQWIANAKWNVNFEGMQKKDIETQWMHSFKRNVHLKNR